MKEDNRVKKFALYFQTLKNEVVRVLIRYSNPKLVLQNNALNYKTEWSNVGVNLIQQETRLNSDTLAHVLASLKNDRLIFIVHRKDGAAQVQLKR